MLGFISTAFSDGFTCCGFAVQSDFKVLNHEKIAEIFYCDTCKAKLLDELFEKSYLSPYLLPTKVND